ncbi:hypothetical protein HKCCE2091_06410 [Rhodobacterales bacterium HKCCE2091]|nr:hypothetical protein [Rhodobacterales bacterium HKCCE2091]
MGPRGLGALEALAACRQGHAEPLAVDIFDTCTTPGAGPNFDPAETPLCLLNIPHRDLSIRPPHRSRVGGFADWLDRSPDPDAFPPRAEIGRYLADRYDELAGLGPLDLRLLETRADRVDPDGAQWVIHAGGKRHGPYDEVLLTPGQPPVKPDPQLAEWQDHDAGALAGAYPARDLVETARGWTGRTVAIRGLGLSTFDVLRALTSGQGGRFDEGRYHPSGREPARILPFSLDGKPPYPKPATKEIDARFDATDEETERFHDAIATAVRADPDTARAAMTAALVPAIRRVAEDMGIADPDPETWIETEWRSPGDQEIGTTREVLDAGIAMASGERAPTCGYILGQLWRKWQDPFRVEVNPADAPSETAATLNAFDEGLKRYSYGPPVGAARELRALADVGIVDLSFAANPEVTTTDGGWTLRCDESEASASAMVDAVLPSPDLDTVDAPIFRDLAKTGRISAVAPGLAARTDADGTLIDAAGRPQRGLALLGRMALGSVMAVDSLHDCFGASSHRWAEAAAKRLDHAPATPALQP